MYDHNYIAWCDEHNEYPEDGNYKLDVALDSIIYSGDLLICKAVKDARMVALESKAILIVDIDCGSQIDEPINRLREYEKNNPGLYRVYKTRNGLRYLQTDCLYHGVNKPALNAFVALGSDPKYIDMCRKTNSFMARLTPKFNSEQLRFEYIDNVEFSVKSDIAVCHFIEAIGRGTSLDTIYDAVEIHDFYTKAEVKNCVLR